jgi:hypothetical protein
MGLSSFNPEWPNLKLVVAWFEALRYVRSMATDHATREVIKACIPAALVLVAIAGALIGAFWWWLG